MPHPPSPFSDSVHWTEYGIPYLNLWHMLLYAWQEVPPQSLGELQAADSAPTLDGLLAAILAYLMRQRLRIGLGRNYSTEHHLLRGLRGRVDFGASLSRHAFERGQTYCDFQQYSLNVPKNQIVRSTLARLVQTGSFGPNKARAEELRQHLRRLVRDLDGIELIELKLDVIQRQQLGRNDRDYRLMLAICELLLQRQMPADTAGDDRLPGLDRDELTLYNIYERFVANFYRVHLHGWAVASQTPLSWPAKTANSYLPDMRPDLVLEDKVSGRMVMLDTKFTSSGLVQSKWGGQKFHSEHLYQIYTYLRTQEQLSLQHQQATGILLYPIVPPAGLSERVELPEHALRIEGVDLTLPWPAIEQRLLDIMAIP